MQEKVLITGFGPFGGDKINPALEAIKLLDGQLIAGMGVITKELPVVRYKAIDCMIGFIREVDPNVIIAIGQASDNRTGITPERIAINVDDFRIKDNEGNQPIDEQVVANGPCAYWSTLPIKSIVSEIRSAGIPANVSQTAGTFVCNHLFYGLMHYLNAEGNIRRGGFIHIPFLLEQAARIPGQPPSMSLDTIVQGLRLAVEATILNRTE